jgi:hypothetical protein
LGEIARHTDGTRNRRCQIRDHAVPPATDLVPEVPKASGESRSDRSLQDHAASVSVNVRDRGLLDNEAALGHEDHEGGVIQVTWTSSLQTRADRLEQFPAPPHDVLPSAHWNPIQIHRRRWRPHVCRRF